MKNTVDMMMSTMTKKFNKEKGEHMRKNNMNNDAIISSILNGMWNNTE